MSDEINKFGTLSRRGFMKATAATAAVASAPTILISNAHAFVNEPKGGTVTLGFNVPHPRRRRRRSAER